ncbi:histidinol-phosphate transaminase [Deltaproteobacteria bacterium]|nr:histidinol-phosphate transaminase [Deltaproteobacteria bacterium]
MKSLISKGIEKLIPYPPGKPIEELERELGITGAIKLASNENPLGPSPLGLQAIMDNIKKINRYPDGSGYYLKSKLSSVFGLPQERIIIGNGSNELIELIIRTFLTPGDEVVQAFPTFLVYEKIVTGAGGDPISVPLKNFKIDLNDIAEAVTPKTKIIFINNPNNPTGSALSKGEMAAFLGSLPKDIILVLDEAYIEFVTDHDVANGLDILMDYPGLIVLRTFSKLYGLAGLRIGYGFSSEEVIDYMNRVRQPFNSNSLAQAAASAALDDNEFVSSTLKLIKDGLSYLYEQLDTLGLEYLPTQTNFFIIKVPLGAKKVYELMLREGVIVRSMESYGLEEYIRINVGLPEENEIFINTIKKVLNDGEC